MMRQLWNLFCARLAALGVFLLSAVLPACSSQSRHAQPASNRDQTSPITAGKESAPQASAERMGTAVGPDKAGRREDIAEQEAMERSQRERMVRDQLRARDITDERVLEVMTRVPRHRFVPEALQDMAYSDGPVPIGHGQTISQPYIVALMTQLGRPASGARALDVGTGSGYQAAVLAELVGEVYSIEIVPELAEEARQRLEELGYKNITVRCGDGYRGWPEHAPFDTIIVAAAPDHIPQPLIDQLASGGRLIIPVGKYFQNLIALEKQKDGSVRQWNVAPVAFVPMVGEAEGSN